MAVWQITTSSLRPGMDPQSFRTADHQAHVHFWSRQPGCVPFGRTLTVDGGGRWTTSQLWDSRALLDAGLERAATDPSVAASEDLRQPGTTSHAVEIAVSPLGSSALSHATGLYLEGIAEGRAEQALNRHTGDRYVQHSTGVRDGRDGFLEFFRPFLAAHPRREITLHRSLTDGRFVFVHVSQRLDDGAANWVTMDLFETDASGRVVEHWDVIAPWQQHPNPAGRTQVDGSWTITDWHLTELNKAIVGELLTVGLARGSTQDLGRWISATQYLQHNPDAPDGLDGLQAMIERGRRTGEELYYRQVHRVVGEGNLVVALSHQVWNSIDYAAMDLFRLEDGLIVEHWDAVEVLPTGDALVNSGKF